MVAADPEVPAAEAAFRARDPGGRLPADRGDPAVAAPGLAAARRRESDESGDRSFEAIAKSTRQRIRGAERDGVTVVRHDTRLGHAGAGEGFVPPAEPAARRARPVLRPAARDRRAAPVLVRAACRRSSAGGRRRWRPATSSTSRRERRRPRGSGDDGEPARGPGPVSPRRAALDRPFGRPRRAAEPSIRAPSTCSAGGRSSWRSARAAREMDLGGVDVGGLARRTARRRPALRPVPAQAGVRRAMAGADRRARAGLRSARLCARSVDRPPGQAVGDDRADAGRAACPPPNRPTPAPLGGLIERLHGRRAPSGRPAGRPGDRRRAAWPSVAVRGVTQDSRSGRAPAACSWPSPGCTWTATTSSATAAARGRRRPSSSALSRRRTCRSSSSTRTAAALATAAAWWYGDPSARARGRRGHRHGRQDDDLASSPSPRSRRRASGRA